MEKAINNSDSFFVCVVVNHKKRKQKVPWTMATPAPPFPTLLPSPDNKKIWLCAGAGLEAVAAKTAKTNAKGRELRAERVRDPEERWVKHAETRL